MSVLFILYLMNVIWSHGLFFPQDYEARLFVLKNERGRIISSAEEAVDFQKKNLALNHFLSKLSQSSHSSTVSDISHEESKKRNVGQRVVVSYFIWLTFALGHRQVQIVYTSCLSWFSVRIILLFCWYKRFSVYLNRVWNCNMPKNEMKMEKKDSWISQFLWIVVLNCAVANDPHYCIKGTLWQIDLEADHRWW